MSAAVLHELSSLPASSHSAKRRGEGLFSVFLLILAFVMLAVCRAYAPLAIQRWFVSVPFENPLDLLLLIGAALAAMVLHELGHLLAAMALGFNILGVSLGPVRLQLLHRTWKLSFQGRNLFAGSVSAMPQTPNHWRPAMLIVVAAGPLATLGAMLFAASVHATGHPASLLQIAFIQISALLLLLGLIPTPVHARSSNDARLLYDLSYQSQGAEEMELNVLLSQQVLAGVRPQDYPDDLIARLAAWRGRPENQLLFAQAVARWALDSENIPLAEAWDLRALALASQCSARFQNAALASSACIDVIFREDLESARTKFDQVDLNALFPKCFELRARACQQFAIGRIDRVPAFVIRAQYALPRGVPAYCLDRALLANLHMKALLAPTQATGVKHQAASA